jgi:hypothetical protein
MALAAAQVVDTLAARLVPMPATGGRVHTSRTWPLTDADLPAWRIAALTEEVQGAAFDGSNEHALVVQASAVARVTADLDDQLNTLAAAGLALLFAPPAPYGLQLDRIQRDMPGDDEASAGAVRLLLRAKFFVHPAQPETLLSN